MTIEEIKNMVEKEKYDFLRTNPHLSGRLVFLTLGGSYAYGTNVETSDVDIRGCALNRKSDLLGLSNFEQVVNTETDTTVYSFNKLVNLLINCNPNTIEDKFTSFENGGIKLLTDKSQRDDLDLEVYCNIHIDKYPAREFQTLLNTLSSVVRNYGKLNHRNHKKDDAHLNKHAMHLVRLYLMCLDILEKQEICTYRENDRDFLLSIRNGAFQNEDGTYKQEFFELISDYETRLQYAKENTSLPEKPDMKRIEEFVMSVNEKSVNA